MKIKLLAFIAFLTLVANAQSGLAPLKIGDEIDVNHSSNTDYNSDVSGIVYTKEFRNIGSSYVKVYLENFDLNDGDFVKIYGANNEQEVIYTGSGKIINNNNDRIDQFWSLTIWDQHIIVELHSQNGSNGHYGFDISKVAYGYPMNKVTGAFESSIPQQETVCGVDDKEQIACYDGTEMGRKAEAVCRLLIGGSGLCTGWLLGTEGHVMTNNHCIGSAADVVNTDFLFNYQNTDCGGLFPDTADLVASSATFIQTSPALDFTLVQLPVNPTGTYGYLSLASVPPVSGERIYHPQHPGGRRKEIAVTTDTNGGPNNYAVVVNEGGDGNGRVTYFHDTEGGSSGSPVLRYDDHLVIAIHNTGSCTTGNGAAGRSDQLIAAIGPNMPAGGVDDPNPDSPRISFVTPSLETTEDTDCSFQDVTYELSIAQPPSQNAELTIGFSGSAAEGSDFELITSNPVTFPAGVTGNQQITLRIYNDALTESRETINMALSLNANGGDATLSSDSTRRHFINDDDLTPANGNISLLIDEDFESNLSSWTVSGTGTSNFAIGNSSTATSANWSAAGNDTDFVFVNDDACNCNMSEERLSYNTPIDLTNVSSATLTFDIKYLDSNDQYASDAFAQTSIDGGVTWQNLGGEIVTYSNWETVSLDMSSLIGQSNVLVSFLYDDLGNWAYAMAIDNVRLETLGEADIFTSTNTGPGAVSATINDSGAAHIYKDDRGTTFIMSSLSTSAGTDFGCAEFSISRAGTGGQSHNGSTGADLVMDKQYTFSAGTTTSHSTDITFYFTEAEVAGWETAVANAGGTFTRSDLFIERASNNVESTEVVPATIGSYGANGVTLTGTFTTLDGVFTFGPDRVLSIEESSLLNMKIYPNPTSDFVNITNSVPMESIEVIDITGKSVTTMQMNDGQREFSLNLSSLGSGIYFIKVSTIDNTVGSYKVIKN